MSIYDRGSSTGAAAGDPVLAEHAAAIRQLGKRVVADVVEIGRRFSECKRICGHGNWLPWLNREFGWEETTAQRFMRVHALAQSKSGNLPDLPVSAIYLLAAPSTPEAARTEIIERAKTGAPVSVAEVKQTIDAAKGPNPAEKGCKGWSRERYKRHRAKKRHRLRDRDSALKITDKNGKPRAATKEESAAFMDAPAGADPLSPEEIRRDILDVLGRHKAIARIYKKVLAVAALDQPDEVSAAIRRLIGMWTAVLRRVEANPEAGAERIQRRQTKSPGAANAGVAGAIATDLGEART
jgi:hypothetical protein